MTKQEYMNELREKLGKFEEELAREILDDYEGHFRDGEANGKKEEEICKELGEIDEIIEELSQFYKPKQKRERKNKSFLHINQLEDTIINEIQSSIGCGIQEEFEKVREDKTADLETDSVENCKKAVIHAFCGDISVVRSQDLTFHLEYRNLGSLKDKMMYHFVSEQKGDTYVGRLVREQGNSSLFHKISSPDIRIIIAVPDSFELLEIHTISGDIKAANYECRDIILETISGDMEIYGGKGKTFHIDAKNGDILLKDAQYEEIFCHSKSGDIKGENINVSAGNVKTVSGDVELSRLKADKIIIHTKSGDVDLSETKVKEIQADTISGDVKMNKIASQKIHVNSVSGDIEVNGQADNLKCHNVSGDLEMQLDCKITGAFDTVNGDIKIDLTSTGEGFKTEVNNISGEADLYCGKEHIYEVKSGSFTMGSGLSKLTLNSVSGDITVRA